MPLVTTKQLLTDAQKNGYAVGAFNVENMEMVQAVVAAAEKASVPVVMHLDHGNSFELSMRAYRAGYTSIMIDGSHESFEDNIAVTKAVVDACHPGGVPVEAELGKVGGKEDDLEGGEGNPYTDPQCCGYSAGTARNFRCAG